MPSMLESDFKISLSRRRSDTWRGSVPASAAVAIVLAVIGAPPTSVAAESVGPILECGNTVECPSKTAPWFRRSGRTLTIVADNGRKARFRDSPKDCQPGDHEPCTVHEAAFVAPGARLAAVRRHTETDLTTVVSTRSGETVATFAGRRSVSPDRQRILFVESSSQLGFFHVIVARVDRKGVTTEFTYESDDTAAKPPAGGLRLAEQATWVSPDEIRLRLVDRSNDRKADVALRRSGDVWRLDPVPGAGVTP